MGKPGPRFPFFFFMGARLWTPLRRRTSSIIGQKLACGQYADDLLPDGRPSARHPVPMNGAWVSFGACQERDGKWFKFCFSFFFLIIFWEKRRETENRTHFPDDWTTGNIFTKKQQSSYS